MGLFKTLMSKIFGGHDTATSQSPTTPAGVAGSTTPVASPNSKPVDIEAVMADLSAKSQEKLDWKTSIVDLMKLVGMDSSFANRQALAKELNFTGDPADSGTMNIWLHKEVMRQLQQNGGKVPASLID